MLLSTAASEPKAAAVQSAAAFPTFGTVRVPVILCAFPDCAFSVEDPVAAFSSMLNDSAYSDNNGTGSVCEYYLESSSRQLSLVFDVLGPYTVSHNVEYYGGNSSHSSSQNAQALIVELINLAGKAGVDFSRYDANNDGVVDNVSVFFAGHNEAEGGDESTIWPHCGTVGNSPKWSGKTFSSYLMTSELRGAKGTNMAGIGTFCHEFGHVLGLPDLYDTSGKSAETKRYTLGDWDVMCSGSYNNAGRTPPLFSAFERFMLGWLTPAQIADAGNYSLAPLSEINAAFLLASAKHNLNATSPSPAEYFLVENRQRVGWEARHAECLPGVGLLVSHITYNSGTWTQNTFNNNLPLGVDIVEAYNPNPTEATAHDSYPGTMNVTAMTPVLNSGDSLHTLRLHNILQRTDLAVSFALGQPTGAGFTFSPARLDTFMTTFDGRIDEATPQNLTIIGAGIPTPTVFVSFTNSYFEIAAGGEWLDAGEALIDTVNSDGSYARTLQVRYLPRRQSCIPVSSVLQVFAADSSLFNQLSLLGVSPRPIYLTQPDSLVASEIEPTTCRIAWREVEDADLYYLYAYTKAELEAEPALVFSREVVAPEDHSYLTGLTPNTTYQVVLCAAESKGCRENRLCSDTLIVTTAIDTDYRRPLPITQQTDGSCVLSLPTNAPEGMQVFVYTTEGRLLGAVSVPADSREVTLSATLFRKHHLYLLKYASASGISRKDYHAKLLYR